MQFFDTHAHIGLIYDDPIEQLRVIQQARAAGVTRIVSINNSLHDFKKVYPNLKNIHGISRDVAYRLVSQTMLGSAKLQQITNSHPGVLKDAVCSPNGTTIRGVDSLEKNGLRGACISSIDVIMDFKK